MNPLAFFKSAKLVLMALAAISGIFLTAGCGSGGPVIVHGGFTKASLKGSYAFTVKGYGLNVGTSSAANFFVEGGVFTSDGNGNISAGTDDFVEAAGSTTQAFTDNVTGTYSISADGSGDLQFNFAAGGSEVFRITLSDINHLYMEEEDGFGTSAGSAELQDPTLLSTIPSGTFVFRTHDVFVSATMGSMAISAGAVTGSFLMVQNGAAVTGSIGAGGSMTAPTAGRGTITYSVNGLTHSAEYYVVSSSQFLLLDTTTNILSVGLAEQQSAIPFSAADLSSSYAFGSSGETTTPGFVNTVGVFTADGTANVTAANYDSVQDGSVASNQTATGTYLIDNAVGNGSGSITIGGLVREIWMVSPSRAYFIALNGSNVEDGTIDQQSGTFTNTSLSAQAAFFMDGFDGNSGSGNGLLKDRVGTLVPSGTDSLGTNYVATFFDPNPNVLVGGANPNNFSGSYSVASNGRTTTVLNGFTDNIILYLTTNSTGYLLQADTGVNMSGRFTAQPTQ
jgi:hypothetical protein